MGENKGLDLYDQVLRDRLKAKLFDQALEPTRIGRYAVVRHLGSGTHGHVYAAFDEQLDRRVAIKVLGTSESEDDGRGRARLLREARVLGKLSHPNVVYVIDVGTTDDGDVFVVTEYLKGSTLREWLEAEERSIEEIVQMYVQAARGLAAAHAAGIVHRDFKPDNVIVGEDGRARVLDFGLARYSGPVATTATSSVEQRLRDGAAGGTELTVPGTLLGTPAYMSPEQCRGNRVEPRSDQFALCAGLYEALFGVRPFVGNSVVELSVAMARGKPEEPTRNARAPAHLRAALKRGLASEPEDRFESMDSLIEALESGPRAGTSARTLSRTLVAAAIVIVILGGIAALLLW